MKCKERLRKFSNKNRSIQISVAAKKVETNKSKNNNIVKKKPNGRNVKQLLWFNNKNKKSIED